MTYVEKLRDPRWQKKRLEILKRDKWKCKYCNDEKTELHVHHIKYTEAHPWDEKMENLMALCKDCHKIVELHKSKGICKLKRFNYEKMPEDSLYLIFGCDGALHFERLSGDNVTSLMTFDTSALDSLQTFLKSVDRICKEWL